MLFIADKYIIIENGSRVCCYHVPPRKIKTILVFAMFLLYKQMFFLFLLWFHVDHKKWV